MSLTETLQLLNNTEQVVTSMLLALLCQYFCHKDFDSAVQETQETSYIIRLYKVPLYWIVRHTWQPKGCEHRDNMIL